METSTSTITHREYILISKGLSHLKIEYLDGIIRASNKGETRTAKLYETSINEIDALRKRLVKPFNLTK